MPGSIERVASNYSRFPFAQSTFPISSHRFSRRLCLCANDTQLVPGSVRLFLPVRRLIANPSKKGDARSKQGNRVRAEISQRVQIYSVVRAPRSEIVDQDI